MHSVNSDASVKLPGYRKALQTFCKKIRMTANTIILDKKLQYNQSLRSEFSYRT